jgi:hypothetical protein
MAIGSESGMRDTVAVPEDRIRVHRLMIFREPKTRNVIKASGND